MPFNVKIRSSDHSFAVGKTESVLDAAMREGIILPYGCRNGTCGTCMGTLCTGEVDYEDAQPVALTERDRAQNRILLCQARPVSDLTIAVREVRTCGDIPVKRLPCRVLRMDRLSEDVMRLVLRLPPTDRLQFLAGQYVEILLPDNRRRGFSIANAPHDDAYIELHVRHVPGGYFSHMVFEQLREKALLRIAGPYGGFYLREDSDRPILLAGGGTGFAPLKAMLEHAFHRGVRRPMHLFWGVRGRSDLYLDELPRAWRLAYANFNYTPVLSEPSPEDRWTAETGNVIDSVVRHYPDLGSFDIYMSGPPAMIEAGKQTFAAHGLDKDRLNFDSFEFAVVAENAVTG
jgi:CDP-4-dehydro-6-deoxyglucose reductase